MMTVKVYLIGFDRPISVIGSPIFEDERFFVIQNDVSKKKIPWTNILYIEEIYETSDSIPAPIIPPGKRNKEELIQEMIAEASKRKKQSVGTPNVPVVDIPQDVMPQSIDLVNINIEFYGDKEETITLKVPADCLDGTYNPKLAKEIFNNPLINLKTGDLIISGVPEIDKNTVRFKTTSTKEIKEKFAVANTMVNSVFGAAQNSSQYGKMPSLKMDQQFAMYDSPFVKPVKFSE